MAKVIRFSNKNLIKYAVKFDEESSRVKVSVYYNGDGENESAQVFFKDLEDCTQGYNVIEFRHTAWMIFYNIDEVLKDKR